MKGRKQPLSARCSIGSCLTALCLFFLPDLVAAQHGGYPLSLSVPPSVRLGGMGQAGTGLIDAATDPSAIWFNPALVAFGSYHLERPDFVFTEDRNVNPWSGSPRSYLAAGWSMGGLRLRTSAGSARMFYSYSYMNHGRNLVTDFRGNVVGRFVHWDAAHSLGMALPLNDAWAIGFTGKFVKVSVVPVAFRPDGEDLEGVGLGFDFGFVYRARNQPVSVGVSVLNLGTGVRFREDVDDPLPRALRAGIAVHALSDSIHSLAFVADMDKSLVEGSRAPLIGFGAEYRILDVAGVRFGYVYEGWYQEYKPNNTYTFGFNVGYGGFRFDYAYVPDYHGEEHRNQFGIGARFGPGARSGLPGRLRLHAGAASFTNDDDAFDTGVAFGIGYGQPVNRWVELEAEFGFERFTRKQPAETQWFLPLSAMLKAYPVGRDDGWRPFVGVGGGPLFLPDGHDQEASTWILFAAQVEAGLSVPLYGRELEPAVMYRNFLSEHEYLPFLPSDRSLHQVGLRVAVGL